MTFTITYRNRRTLEEYTLGNIEAQDRNEAVRIAKEYRGPEEEIASIDMVAASIFSDLYKMIQGGFRL